MRAIGVTPQTVCWHCGETLGFTAGEQTARYLYRGDQPFTVLVEDWIRCACGAYQNVRRLNEISVESFGNR